MISLKYKLIHIATLLEVFTPIMTYEVAPAYFSILTSCFLLAHYVLLTQTLSLMMPSLSLHPRILCLLFLLSRVFLPGNFA